MDYDGLYDRHKEEVWGVGVFLLILVLGAGFSNGYIRAPEKMECKDKITDLVIKDTVCAQTGLCISKASYKQIGYGVSPDGKGCIETGQRSSNRCIWITGPGGSRLMNREICDAALY